MAARTGRKVALTWDAAAIPGVREKSLSLNGEAIDISSDESDGWRHLLDEPGENQVNISLSGVTKASTLREAWFAGERTAVATLTYPDGGVLTGSFYMATYSETEPYNDATTFETELQSTGEVTYTPATP